MLMFSVRRADKIISVSEMRARPSRTIWQRGPRNWSAPIAMSQLYTRLLHLLQTPDDATALESILAHCLAPGFDVGIIRLVEPVRKIPRGRPSGLQDAADIERHHAKIRRSTGRLTTQMLASEGPVAEHNVQNARACARSSMKGCLCRGGAVRNDDEILVCFTRQPRARALEAEELKWLGAVGSLIGIACKNSGSSTVSAGQRRLEGKR